MPGGTNSARNGPAMPHPGENPQQITPHRMKNRAMADKTQKYRKTGYKSVRCLPSRVSGPAASFL